MTKQRYVAYSLAIAALLASPPAFADRSETWTLAELHQALVDAEHSGDRMRALLATKTYSAMRKQGVKLINRDMVFSASAPGFRDGLDGYNTDIAKHYLFDVVNGLSPIKSVGSCSALLPAYSLLAVESPGANFGGQLYGDETLFLGRVAPGQIQVGVYAVGKLSATAGVGLVWGGFGVETHCTSVPYPCPTWSNPFKICYHDVCAPVPSTNCTEWTDSVGLKAEAEVAASLVATLNTSFSAADHSIVIKKNVSLSGEIYSFAGTNSDLPPFTVTGAFVPYVTPDIGQIRGNPLSQPVSAQVLAQTAALPIAADAFALGALGPLASAASVLQAQAGAVYGLSLVGTEQRWVRDSYASFIAKQNASFDAAGYNQPIVIQLPSDVNDQLLADVLGLLHNLGVTDFLVDFVRSNIHEILYYILTNDRASLDQFFASAATCKAISALAVPMQAVPLYGVNASGSCAQANLNGNELEHYYADSHCINEVAYRPTPAQAYCDVVLAANPNSILGNAASWTPDLSQANDATPNVPSRKWTQWPGVRLPLSVESIANDYSPYMKQVHYRDVVSAGHTATCALEMRVYKKSITSQNQPALLALHGGSWAYRGLAFNALETTISHYTERGFVVFAPFYRLTGRNDGDAACNMAQWQEVTSDVEAALDWVKTYGALYGAEAGKIAVTGQSAGAHLSEWLVTHRPDDVSAALLHYPPTDIFDFLSNAHVGGIYEAWMPSLGILNGYFGTDLAKVNVTSPPSLVVQNSFAQLVHGSTRPVPPSFILQGVADSVVPSNQSVVLCNAYGGVAQNSGGGVALRAIYGCGSGGGQLHLFQEGEHGLDACVANGHCFSGGTESAALVADSERRGRDWLYALTKLSITPARAQVRTLGSVTFSATGGSGTGYTWSLSTGASGGSITSAGVYTAGAVGGTTDVVQLSDSLGNVASADVEVSAPDLCSNVTCAALDDCHEVGACEAATGICSNPAKADLATCSIGVCQAGVCTQVSDAESPGAGTVVSPDSGQGGAATAPKKQSGWGCSSSDGPASALLLLGLVGMLPRRRRGK